jgi:hypothetical protein
MRWALILCLSASALRADPLTFYSNEGDIYDATINANGAVLTSRHPKSWFHGEPTEDHEVHTAPAKIYLGRACDALHSELGKGTWDGGNGAFGATFGSHVITFQRQELDSTLFPNCYGSE